MNRPTKSLKDGDEEDTGGGSRRTKAVKWRPRKSQGSAASAAAKWSIVTMSVFFLITGTAAVLSNSTFKGEQQSDINARIGQSAYLPCELEPNNVTMGFEITTQCGIVHSVKWYRGASRIFLYSGGPRTTQPHREGYTDRYDRSYWSTEPNSTLGYLVMDNVTALDEAVYKCEITYTKVHEGCNIVQFINLTTYSDPESINVGTLVDPGDPSAHNYIEPTSDFHDGKDKNPKFGIMKKLTSGASVGPVDEGKTIRLVCRAGRARPVPQITWWQHNRGQIDDDDFVDYQSRKVDSDPSDDNFSYSGLWVAQSVLTVFGKRGANGRYECRVKTATDSSPILTSSIDVTVNVSPYSVEMATSSSGSTVTTISKVEDRQKENGENAGDVVYAETTEGQPLVIRCAARGARPQANVTWYYYYKDQEDDDDDDYGSGVKNDLNTRTSPAQSSKSSKHGTPVVLGNSQQSGGSTVRSPSDYLISEQRRMEGGAEIIGPVEIAQHTEYQADGTRDTHSQLSMSQLHRQQDGSILRCDAFNNVGASPSQPLTVNMTIRVKYAPTAWVVPITDGVNSGAIVQDEIGQQRKSEFDGSVNPNLNINDAYKVTNDGLHYQTSLYTVVVNETKELRLQCAYHANPDKLRTPVKWYRDGTELQLVDEEEQPPSSASSYGAATLATGAGTVGGPSNSARTRVNAGANAAKYARVKGLVSGGDGDGIHGDVNGEDATVLVVRRLTRFDSGHYECRVRNSVGAANSTNFANVRVQYTPKVKLHVILDDTPDGDEMSTIASIERNNIAPSNPIVLESDHRNVTLRCAVQLEPDQKHISDTNSDPSLNLTSVHWYWNGVQMQLHNCSRSPDSNGLGNDVFEDEDDGNDDLDSEMENENNGMNVNYYTSEMHGEGDYDVFAVDNDTRLRNKKQRKVVCTDRELILVNVTKNIHGNYSCRARNAAGLLTPMSDQTPLIVYFAPGPVTVEFSPRRVIKGRNVTMRCNAQYLGRPQHPTNYSWYRDKHPLHHPNTNSGTGNPEWFVEHVSLETRANFTCSAHNDGGTTESEPVYIEVFAPPNYITGPPQYLGVAFNASHVNASCTVECYPHCSVYWLRRGVLIDPINNPMDKERYTILTEYLPAERLKNDFEAVRSTLIWRMDNWPGGRGLDPITDSTEYSCRSSGNDVGPPVSELIMNFSVEYPPRNITVSKTMVHVSEGNIPEKVFCHAEGRPQPTFEWLYIANANNPGNFSQSTQPILQQRILSAGNNGPSLSVSSGSGSGINQINNQQLVLNSAVGRHQAGYYACVARNTHGNETAYTYLDVTYKPSCQLRMLTVDQLKQETTSLPNIEPGSAAELDEFITSSAGDKRVLVCTASANPIQVQYTWTVRDSGHQNDTTLPLTSDSPATDRVITVVSVASPETDSAGNFNRSVLVLQDRLEVSVSEGDSTSENAANVGVRTYVCSVNNTVGWDQCTIQVQGDAPWWKQLLAAIGLGGLPVMFVLAAIVAILVLIVVIIIVILLQFVCKNRYIKPGNEAQGGRQKYVKQIYPTLTAYKVPVVWRRHRSRGVLSHITKVRQNPEGSATSSISGANPATQQCLNRSVDIGTPKPPPGYGDDVNGNLTESFSDRQNTSNTSAVGKWPLKPGVLVHSKQQLLKMQSTAHCQSGNVVGDGAGPGGKNVSIENDKGKSKKNVSNCKAKLSADGLMLANETQSARAERIRRMMIGTNNNFQKKLSPTSPPPVPPVKGNSNNSTSNVEEKYHLKTASRGGSAQPQDNDSNLGTASDSKAAFYENLPFHGMRPPPNQTSISQRVSSNKNNEGSKPPVPLPQSTVPKNKPSLICQSPNGGYVSLLRQTISKLGNADNDCSTVQFNSLQRPNRGIIATSQHRERVQFRSMRTVSSSSKNDTRKTADYRRSFIAAIGHDKNNNCGNGKKLTNIDSDNYCEDKTMPVESRKCNEKQNVGNDERNNVIGSLTSKSFPKPAPRTRVPSGTVGPSLAHHETYENLQNLLKNDDDIDKKLTGVGIGARSLDEFYRMQMQQQQQILYNRVTANDLTVGGTLHNRQQQPQQSIEMTQFEVTGSGRGIDGGGGTGGESSYQKLSKHHQLQNVAGRYYNNNNDNSGTGSTADGCADADVRIKSTLTGGGTIGRRRRASQQTESGPRGSVDDSAIPTDHCSNNNDDNGIQHQYPCQQQHGTRRRSNASAASDGRTVIGANSNSYNTIAGGIGYYAADVYASIAARQQQAKRQQRPSPAVGSGEQTLTAKRSWRRLQNRRRRPGVGVGDPVCDVDDESPPPPDSDPVADVPAKTDKYRNVLTTSDRHHHHRPRQKNDLVRVVSVDLQGGQPPVVVEQQVNGGSGSDYGNNKNLPYTPPMASGYAEDGDLEYADVDYRTMYSYGPINYKQAS